MRVDIHIGAHKTGTKSIQAFLRQHARAFAAAGICVPRSGTILPLSGHHNIGWGLRDDARFSSGWGTLDDLIAELARANSASAVISCEDLEYLADRPADLARLEDGLRRARHRPRYIWFTRRADNYAHSLYVQLLRHGLTCDFPQFVDEIARTGKFVLHDDWSFYFDREAFAAAWQRGATGELVMVDYDGAASGPGVVPAFMALIGAPPHLVELSKRADVLNLRQPTEIPAEALRHGLARVRERFGLL